MLHKLLELLLYLCVSSLPTTRSIASFTLISVDVFPHLLKLVSRAGMLLILLGLT